MINNEKIKPFIPWIILIAVITVIPVMFTSPFVISIMVFIGFSAVLALGMGMLLGQAGLLSLTQPAWFGVGAYVTGILVVREILPPVLSIIVGAVIVALLSYIVGLPVLRLKGLYLACATFGILLIAQISFTQLRDLTGGHSGLFGIPPLSIGSFVFKTGTHYYFLIWAICILFLWFLLNLVNSRVGRAINATRDSEAASQTMGVNIAQYRLQAFVLVSSMAGLVGGIFAFYLRIVTPSSFGFSSLIELMFIVVVGGYANLWGVLLGSIVVMWLKEFISIYLLQIVPLANGAMAGALEDIFFGVLIILILIFVPSGLTGMMEKLVSLAKKFLFKGEKKYGPSR